MHVYDAIDLRVTGFDGRTAAPSFGQLYTDIGMIGYGGCIRSLYYGLHVSFSIHVFRIGG